MTHESILLENESKRLTFRLPLLFCFALYFAWQMGVGYFSGDTLSINGRTPLPFQVDGGIITASIAAGYVLSIIFMLVFPRLVVWAERLSGAAALLSAIALFLPLPSATLAGFYYAECFCCLFMIGFESAIIINLFSGKTAIGHLLVAYAPAQILVAVLHNDFIKIPFPVFRVFTVAALSLMLVFFWKLPAKSWPRYVKKTDGIVAPKALFAGIVLLTVLGNFIVLFGTAIAESVSHGLTALYISSAGFGLVVFGLWKRHKVTPIKSGKVLVAVAAMGFIAAVVSQYVPWLSLIACVLLGAGVICGILNPFFGIIIAKQYPSKWITPAIIGFAFVTVLVQTALLDALRENLTALFLVYLGIAVALVILYLILEPYLLYAFHGKPLISNERAARLIEAAKEAENIGGVLAEDTRKSPAALILEEAESHEDDELTDREKQVAQEFLSGLSAKEIASKLHIAVNTVMTHKKRIYAKKDIHSHAEFVVKLGRLQTEKDTEGEGE